MINKLITHFKNDHLYRNSLYLMGSTVVLAGFGFFFWIIAARKFTTDQVGIATTLISMATLISSLGLLGLNISLNRFLPKSEEKNELISSSSILVTLACILITAIFLLGVNTFSPQLTFLNSNYIYISTFIFFIIILSLNTLLDFVFIAYRASGNILFKNIVLSVLKIIFVLLFTTFGAYGIFASFTTAMVISFFIGLVILIYKFKFRLKPRINIPLVKSMSKFSIGNYISSLLASAPLLILPIIIVNSIGATSAAYYYIDAMILGLLVTIPASVAQSLLTEGSHDDLLLKQHIIKASKITYLLLIPSVIVTILFGNYVLQFFGDSYALDAFRFLQIISISALFMPVALFGNSILRINHKIKALIVLNLFGCISILTSCYLLSNFGLIGIGFGILAGQVIVTLAYVLYFFFSLNQIKNTNT